MSENTHDTIGELNKEYFSEQQPNGGNDQMDEMSRRKFMVTLLGMTGGAIALTLAVPIVNYAISPAMVKSKEEFIAVGNLADFPAGKPTKVEYSFRRKDGWIEAEVKQSCWVMKKDDANIKVFSPNCTHLGCGYAWDDASQQFKCPCHGAVFSAEGEVVAGPPPRPLDQFATKIENGKLLVGKLKKVEG
jgi:menaquinol-cytochrome c reductase iron-sulfur subunit